MSKDKEYIKKKGEDQSPEPRIGVRRSISEKLGNGNIRKSLMLDKNYSHRQSLIYLSEIA